jgi:Cu/Ag efflux pump CusA
VVSANVSGRDLRSTVNQIQAQVKQQVPLPAGYFIQYGGQFEAEERATQNILIFSAIAFVVICVLMYLSVQSIASTAMIMINLPIGLVGGIFAVALTGGVISVASLVGFVTLFGVATRNGLLLVDTAEILQHQLPAPVRRSRHRPARPRQRRQALPGLALNRHRKNLPQAHVQPPMADKAGR